MPTTNTAVDILRDALHDTIHCHNIEVMAFLKKKTLIVLAEFCIVPPVTGRLVQAFLLFLIHAHAHSKGPAIFSFKVLSKKTNLYACF